jgi:pilus assembly protein CpaF
MFAIVVNEKGGEQKRLEFDKPEVTIGRVQGNDIILPKGNVSKRHSRIVLKDGKFIIVDLKSTNGTYVNGRKITSPLVVKGSDKIYIGDFILSIEELGASQAASDEGLAPPPPPRKAAPSIPPPPPRRAPTQPQEDFEAGGEPGPTDDEQQHADEPESTPPPPAPERPARPSSPAVAPAPLPPRPAPAPAARPASIAEPARPSRPDFPAPAPAPRPTLTAPAPRIAPAAPAPAAAPASAAAAAAVRRPTPAAVPKPTNKSMPTVDDGKRARLSEVMRELSARLASALGGVDSRTIANSAEELWSRAENAAADLVEQLQSDGALPAGVDTDALLKDVVAETVGVGPLEELLGDDNVREVTIARHDRIFVDRGGQVSLAGKWFSSPEAVARAVERLLHRAGRAADLDQARSNGALVEARIDGGLLLTAALPPLAARGPSVSIRRPRRHAHRLGDLVGEGLLSQGMAEFLELAVKSRRNVVVSGPAGSGRSTVLQAMARAAEGERVVSVEEAEEIDLGDGHWIPLVGKGGGARQALSYALRLKPERLVVGDVRGPETLELLTAMAAGTDGVLCVVQASSPRHALDRLAQLARLAPEAPSQKTINEELGRGVNLIVHLSRSAEGELRVAEVVEVAAGDDAPSLQPIFTHKPEGGGRFAATGHVPPWAEGAPPSMFRA